MAPPKEHRKPPPLPADERLRDFKWVIEQRPAVGPVLWRHKELGYVLPQPEALAWCDRELRRVKR